MRLPLALDNWFSERLARHPEQSPSEVLVALVHGGLRLRDGYMAIHRRELEHHIHSGSRERYETYLRCLRDTFGAQYVEHLERWLVADGILDSRSDTAAPRPPQRV